MLFMTWMFGDVLRGLFIFRRDLFFFWKANQFYNVVKEELCLNAMKGP